MKSVPSKDKTIDCFKTGLAALKLVPKPPKKITKTKQIEQTTLPKLYSVKLPKFVNLKITPKSNPNPIKSKREGILNLSPSRFTNKQRAITKPSNNKTPM